LIFLPDNSLRTGKFGPTKIRHRPARGQRVRAIYFDVAKNWVTRTGYTGYRRPGDTGEESSRLGFARIIFSPCFLPV
jgi:hypothetical protein